VGNQFAALGSSKLQNQKKPAKEAGFMLYRQVSTRGNSKEIAWWAILGRSHPPAGGAGMDF
jgi:hypothetical protein